MDKTQARLIAEKFAAGTATDAEHAAFFAWLSALPVLESRLLVEEYSAIYEALPFIPSRQDLWEKIYQQLDEPIVTGLTPTAAKDSLLIPIRPRRKWLFTAAAAILLLLGTGLYFLFRHQGAGPIAVTRQQPLGNDVAPGHNGAVLTLANGRQIVLDSAHTGSLAIQGTTTISLAGNGQLDYSASGGHSRGVDHSGEVLYNILSTPRARKTTVVLADGTRVWLNAASSIKYPTAFAGKERRVEVSGEAYFEIKKEVSRPFVVKRMGTDESIEVLGTEFDVNAYNDEAAMKATLLQGSVKVIRGRNSNLLRPGQQAVLANGRDDIQVIDDVNVDEVMAWKNSRFIFSNMDLKTIMRQLTRWYDVDVVFEGNAPDIRIGGIIHNDVYLSTVMAFLGDNGVRYKIEGKKITILK